MKVDYNIIYTAYWVRGIILDRDINAAYPLVFSLLLFIVAELMLFVAFFWCYYHNITVYTVMNSSKAILLTLLSFYNNSLHNIIFSLTTEIYSLTLTLSDELVYYVVNVHGLHILLGSYLTVRIYWYFIDILWTYITYLFYF
jgi:hypothetical protein